METVALAKELVKIEKQIAKMHAIFAKLVERRAEILRLLDGA